MTPLELAVLVLASGAVFFSLVAAVGVVRLPDVYARAHATSKSDTVGTGLALAAVGLTLESGSARLKLAMLVAFVLLTNPVAAHAITRAAHVQGIPHWTTGTTDDRLSPDGGAAEAATADRDGGPTERGTSGRPSDAGSGGEREGGPNSR